jgi:hypothetical protein
MATMTAPPRTSRGETGAGPGRHRGRALTVLAVLLACVGLVLAGLEVRGVLAARTDPALGDAVDTGFGTLTVTRARTTFVPATQGPPTMAQMTGSTGTGQLQVWVRLANTEAARAVAYSADQFRLVDGAGHQTAPDGSSLAAARLPQRAVVDGQVWFDLPSAQADGERRWLEFREASGRTVRIALPVQAATEVTSHDHDGEDEHEDGHEH